MAKKFQKIWRKVAPWVATTCVLLGGLTLNYVATERGFYGIFSAMMWWFLALVFAIEIGVQRLIETIRAANNMPVDEDAFAEFLEEKAAHEEAHHRPDAPVLGKVQE